MNFLIHLVSKFAKNVSLGSLVTDQVHNVYQLHSFVELITLMMVQAPNVLIQQITASKVSLVTEMEKNALIRQVIVPLTISMMEQVFAR